MRDIKLTIIMPLNNVSQWIDKCLSSIPIRDDVEVIIIENGSTDDTLMKCLCYKNPNCYVYHFDEPLGCGQAINEGYERANGEYLLQLDGDDYLFTDALNSVLDNDLGNDLIYFNMLDNNGTEWVLSPLNCEGLPDHTSLIKRTFLGDIRMPILEEDRFDIGHGYRMFQELLKKEHTRTFTNMVVYYYNYPREGSVYWNATHKTEL